MDTTANNNNNNNTIDNNNTTATTTTAATNLSNVSNGSITEQKYLNLRKRLDQLGYRQTLGIESLPLIEKLFNDLVHTTESLKKTKLELNKSTDQLNVSLKNTTLNGSCGSEVTAATSSMPNAVQAYKNDNAKLIKENNELHLELIRIKDDYEAQLKDIKASLRKVEHENSDLRFLNTQYIHKLRAIEKESKDKSKKILELQEKNFQAVIQTSSSSLNSSKQHQQHNSFSFRRQRLDIDCMLPAANSNKFHQTSLAVANDPYMIDMIKLADERISQLQSELDSSKQSLDVLENKVSNYKNQVIKT
jgi:centrosomal protein CEP135